MDEKVPDGFLRTVQSMTEFAETIKMLKDASDKNYAVTLAPAQCASIIWAMQLLRIGPEDG